MSMAAADFLFPRDLQVSDSGISNVLIVGSCAAAAYYGHLKKSHYPVHFDYLLTNNMDVLPLAPPSPISDYNFQFVQLALRDLLTDKIVNYKEFLKPSYRQTVMDAAINSLEHRLEAILYYNKIHGLLTFVSNFQVPQRPAVAALDQIYTSFDICNLVRRLNDRLVELIDGRHNVYISDIDAVGNSLGKRYFQDDLMGFYAHGGQWYPLERDYDVAAHHNAPAGGRIDHLPDIDSVYVSSAPEFFEAIWRQWESMYRTINQIDAVKLVIFDLDDTMWRGQIAEHYGDDGGWPVFHGWPTGLWEAIQHLRARGIMTAICSKNEEALVRDRWNRAVMEGWLSLDDFLFVEINWNPKALNVAKIIKQAALTERSVLFIDDNPVERESVRLALPNVRVIGSNPYVLRRILLWSPETQVASLTDESLAREEMIRRQVERELQRDSMSREEFLRQLNCRVKIDTINSTSNNKYARCIELLNKTNQFNTTGERRSSAEIEKFLNEGGVIYAFAVDDKYTNYGVVGVILYKDHMFKQFVMSCRVLGLGVETSVINAILMSQSAERVAVFASVIETEANMVSRDIYARCGFVRNSSDLTRFEREAADIDRIAPHLDLTINNQDLESRFDTNGD